ncbi:sensor domain-containing diguanylate cyclase [Pseudobutyrivibrio sp. UC1225]|uniref:sensor domain-containing diguanylate cyclase n=1 Tax=Pseudobutyrivibrio sp. UC1225 TaxID=1798185 RepID=UPI0015A564BB|nr:GGDEF domain-containing protein [Pseudobutyrivibrio sp. UC1225]
MLVFGGRWFTSSSNFSISCLDSGWSVFRDGEVSNNVSLSKYKIGRIRKGERITISQTIFVPDKSTLMFRTKLQAVDLLVDGRIRYSFGKDEFEKGKLIPKRYSLIDMSPQSGMHNIMLTYTMGENDSSGRIAPIYFGQRSYLVRAFYSYNRISMFVGSFLVVYSCLLFSLSIYLAFTRRSAIQIYIGADFSMLLGCYVFARNDILWFIGSHDVLFSMLEYIAFYLMPLAFSIILYSIHPDLIKRTQRTFITINIVFPIVFLLLHFMGILHINRMVSIVGILDIVEILVILPPLIRGIVDKQKINEESEYYFSVDADFYLLFGFIMMLVFSLLEMLIESIFNDEANLTDTKLFPSIDLLELGMLIFMLCYFVYYFMNGINHMSADRVKKQLEGMAFTDALTGLLNRAACNQYFANLFGNYTIISLDLDKLKYVNDHFGHMTGDKMIIAFAKILEIVYADSDMIARTGGDEFVVVFKNIDEKLCEACVRDLEEKMQKYNAYSKDISLGASVGYAFSKEVPGGRYQDVFTLADQRMYEMKEVHHG